MAEKKRVRPLSLKKNEEKEIYDFVELQTNLSDTLVYLIQKEIAENGVRDLQMHIPAKRTIESVKELLDIKNNNILKEVPVDQEVVEEKKVEENSESKEIEKVEIDEELLNSF